MGGELPASISLIVKIIYFIQLDMRITTDQGNSLAEAPLLALSPRQTDVRRACHTGSIFHIGGVRALRKSFAAPSRVANGVSPKRASIVRRIDVVS
jgi:hypothetical protein